MASLHVVPMQLLGIGCEVLFLLDKKLRAGVTGGVPAAAPHGKSDMVMDEVARAIFGNALLGEMFTRRKPLSVDDLRGVMLAAVTNPSLKIASGSFDRLFAVACMAMKSALLRAGGAHNIVSVMDAKLAAVGGMLSNPHTRADVDRARSATRVFYGSLNAGDIARARTAQLNALRSLAVPVAPLVDAGLQLPTGHLVPAPADPAAAAALGALRTFDKDGGLRVAARVGLAGVGGGGGGGGGSGAVVNVFEWPTVAAGEGGAAVAARLRAEDAAGGGSEAELRYAHEDGLASFSGGFAPPSRSASFASDAV